MKQPSTPFSTRLSGSAKETELRLRNIFQWKKKRPPVIVLAAAVLVVVLCGSLIGFHSSADEKTLYEVYTAYFEEEPIEMIYYANTDYGFFTYSAGSKGFTDVEEFLRSIRLGNTVGRGKYVRADDKDYHIFEIDDVNGKRIRIKFFMDDNVVLVGSPSGDDVAIPTFANDSKAYRLANEIDQDTMLELLYSAGAEKVSEDTEVPDVPAIPTKTANQEVIEYVEVLFENEKDNVNMQCFLLPGTGPILVEMDEYKEQVCAVFAQYTWTREEGEEPEWERSVDDWTLYFNSGGTCNITAGSYSTWIRIDQVGSPTVCYSYDGEPGSLNDALADLWEGPEIRYALVTLSENTAGSQTLAEAYADAFRELYLASGAITEYELLSVELLGKVSHPAARTSFEDPDPTTPSFTMTYRVKPVDPTASCWEYYAPGEDGWATCSVEMHLNLAGYESAEVWRAAWWEYL